MKNHLTVPIVVRNTRSQVAFDSIMTAYKDNPKLLLELSRNLHLSKQSWYRLLDMVTPSLALQLVEHELDDNQVKALINHKNKDVRERIFISGRPLSAEMVELALSKKWFDAPLAKAWLDQNYSYQSVGNLSTLKVSHLAAELYEPGSGNLTQKWQASERLQRIHQMSQEVPLPQITADLSDIRDELYPLEAELDTYGITGWSYFIAMIDGWLQQPKEMMPLVASIK